LSQNDVEDILKQDPSKPFCATWLHIWEYSF
jgi:lipoprotein NlpI